MIIGNTIYNELIGSLGKNLAEYNTGVWALFRDQMAADMSNQYIFGGGKKPDESLLLHNKDYIQETNKIVRGVKKKDAPDFTYFTQNGPVKELNNKPILSEPSTDKLHINSDYKVKLDETSIRRHNGKIFNGEYEEVDNTRKNINLHVDTTSYLGGTGYENVRANKDGLTLLSKTKAWFENNQADYISKRFATIISRFNTDENKIPIDELKNSVAVQGFSNKYGLSHGNNVLKRNAADNAPENYSNGYYDPYCRVWTWHKQYYKLSDAMRPFPNADDGGSANIEYLDKKYKWSSFRSKSTGNDDELLTGWEGGTRLQKHGVMSDNGGNYNGLVNITPSIGDTYDRSVEVKKCMFSIENLAWKGTYSYNNKEGEIDGLSSEQKGPLGGRIMWFPPYDLKFDETSTANWQTNEFIGRGEPVYTYANTVRSGNLSFKLLIDHPAILDYWDRRDELAQADDTLADKVESKEQELLRFFAGCDVLMAKNNENKPPKTPPKDKDKHKTGPVDNNEKKIKFFVFFPNNYSGSDDRKVISNPDIYGVHPIDYLVHGVGTSKEKSDTDPKGHDFPPNALTRIIWKREGYDDEDVGGYEMRGNVGVSLVDDYTTTDVITTVTEVYDGNETDFTLVKMVGNVNPLEEAPTDPEKLRVWNKKRYYYRVDDVYLNQILVNDELDGAGSYIDTWSYGLNSSIQRQGRYSYENAFVDLLVNVSENEMTCSLCDMYLALNNYKYDGVFDGLYSQKNIDTIQSILNGDKGKIKKIICRGSASSHGYGTENVRLSKERRKTVECWLKSYKPLSDEKLYSNEKEELDRIIDELAKSYNDNELVDSNYLNAKLHRFVLVEIVYGGSVVEDGNDTNVKVNQDGTQSSSVVSNKTINTAKKTDDSDKGIPLTADVSSNVRYDNEARFFQRLTETSPFMTNLISERIKNFDPVFHSMSPEGFNARLTFLNQCMRQGPTISNTDALLRGIYNANNMAFGRPPVCVLRVGDFYNTKIVITNLNITYDPLTWDLNQEGIGVMPMIANVSISFNFIGGSDLGGPIQRLQNATSFNYYANAGVYDNRAENIEYNTPDNVEFKGFDPFINKIRK